MYSIMSCCCCCCCCPLLADICHLQSSMLRTVTELHLCAKTAFKNFAQPFCFYVKIVWPFVLFQIGLTIASPVRPTAVTETH